MSNQSEWDRDTRNGRFDLNSKLGRLKRERDQALWDMKFLLWLAHKAGDVPIDEEWKHLIPDHWPPL